MGTQGRQHAASRVLLFSAAQAEHTHVSECRGPWRDGPLRSPTIPPLRTAALTALNHLNVTDPSAVVCCKGGEHGRVRTVQGAACTASVRARDLATPTAMRAVMLSPVLLDSPRRHLSGTSPPTTPQARAALIPPCKAP